jgi:hypothetical protein
MCKVLSHININAEKLSSNSKIFATVLVIGCAVLLSEWLFCQAENAIM